MTVEAKALMMRDAVDDFMMKALVLLYWNKPAEPFCLDRCAIDVLESLGNVERTVKW